MNKQQATWQLIDKSLRQNISVMLLYVLESKGSSPGRQGFCMAVNATGNMEGSIGGGIMEHKFVELAKEKLRHNEAERMVRKQVHQKNAGINQSGMICSGEQTVLLYAMHQEEAVHVQRLLHCLTENACGRLQLSSEGLSFSEHHMPQAAYAFRFDSADEWKYEERYGYLHHLFIIGGGHCALALSKIMHLMDFYIHLYEDRPNLNTLQQNNFAHEIKTVTSYTELKELIPAGMHHYVVIMTSGYRTDDLALRALIHKAFGYVGLLGSKMKVEKMFQDYLSAGIREEHLRKIHAPIGLPISSQTPEEIAISIAAEIIQVKNGGMN